MYHERSGHQEDRTEYHAFCYTLPSETHRDKGWLFARLMSNPKKKSGFRDSMPRESIRCDTTVSGSYADRHGTVIGNLYTPLLYITVLSKFGQSGTRASRIPLHMSFSIPLTTCHPICIHTHIHKHRQHSITHAILQCHVACLIMRLSAS